MILLTSYRYYLSSRTEEGQTHRPRTRYPVRFVSRSARCQEQGRGHVIVQGMLNNSVSPRHPSVRTRGDIVA